MTSDHPLLAVPLWETGGVEQKLLPTDYRGALSCEKKDLGLKLLILRYILDLYLKLPQAMFG